MKALNILFVAASAVFLTSCGGGKEESVEKSMYKLDVKASSLKWKGSKSADYFHTGTVGFSEGSVEMEGDKLVSGTFTIDMNSITTVDESLPEDKKEMLASHLKDTSFFFVAEHPKVTVTISGYENGKLTTLINVRGQEIKQDIPVKLTVNDKTVSLKGKFDLDVATLKMPGMEPDPESGEKIQSKISYDLDVTLNK